MMDVIMSMCGDWCERNWLNCVRLAVTLGSVFHTMEFFTGTFAGVWWNVCGHSFGRPKEHPKNAEISGETFFLRRFHWRSKDRRRNGNAFGPAVKISFMWPSIFIKSRCIVTRGLCNMRLLMLWGWFMLPVVIILPPRTAPAVKPCSNTQMLSLKRHLGKQSLPAHAQTIRLRKGDLKLMMMMIMLCISSDSILSVVFDFCYYLSTISLHGPIIRILTCERLTNSSLEHLQPYDCVTIWIFFWISFWLLHFVLVHSV